MNNNHKKAGVAILWLIDLKSKEAFYLSSRHNNYKDVCNQRQSPKIHEANTNKIEERNKQWNNKFYILQYPTFNND